MKAIIDLLARSVISGKIKLEDIGIAFDLRRKTEERLKEIQAEGGR